MIPTRKLIFGLIYGLASGLVFALTAWGMNAFLLGQAHFAYPWLAFLIGVLPVMLITGTAGYLTMQLDNAILGAGCWLVGGILTAIIGVWLPLWIVPEVLPRLDPVMKGWLELSWANSYTFLTYSAAIVMGIAGVIAGVLETVLLDQAAYSPYNGAIVMPLIICALISGVGGGVIDNLVNTRFRGSVIAVDRLIEFALENRGKTIDPVVSRQMHMGALSTIQPYLTGNYRMYYFSFNETADDGKILVDFNGHWALCEVFLNQPAFCRAVEPPK